MMKFLTVVLACGALAACAPAEPQSQAEQADAASCTAQADAAYNASTLDQQARPSQNGLLFGTTPTQVFEGEKLGAEHDRESQISDCEQNGSNGGPDVVNGTTVVTPHIINP